MISARATRPVRVGLTTTRLISPSVAGIASEPRDLAIVRSIVDLAKAFDRDVVAEGVERVEQLRILRELGVDHAQGFLFGRPQPIEKIDARAFRELAYQLE